MLEVITDITFKLLTIITSLQDQTKKRAVRAEKKAYFVSFSYNLLSKAKEEKLFFLNRYLLEHIKHFSWVYVRDILLQRFCSLHSWMFGCL